MIPARFSKKSADRVAHEPHRDGNARGQYHSVFKARHELRRGARIPAGTCARDDWKSRADESSVHQEVRRGTRTHAHARGGRERLGTVRLARSVQARTRRRDRLRARVLRIRNNDKVGLILFSDEWKIHPARKGRGHVLRVIREVLFSSRNGGTDLVTRWNSWCASRRTAHSW